MLLLYGFVVRFNLDLLLSLSTLTGGTNKGALYIPLRANNLLKLDYSSGHGNDDDDGDGYGDGSQRKRTGMTVANLEGEK